MSNLRVGMIVPPAGDQVPPEATEIYPSGIDFFAKSLSISSVSAEAFDVALQGLVEAIEALSSHDPDVVSMMGTSISFYHGWEGHERLLERMRVAAGEVPVTTMADAVVKGLRKVGARNVAVGCAYHQDLETRLHSFVTEAGFNVVAAERMDLTNVGRVLSVDTEEIVALGDKLHASAPEADAMLISCGGLRTLGATKILEEKHGVPVISSAVAGVVDAVEVGRSKHADR
ncbi:aspartate/glutamate racemase family protein [Enemella sp. A6]|uniref:aspartate racemase/maleate isomerase family protein n=1 Tax=Enemella sp. A6 TaxID=3440152 RepID=UPI003EB912E8